MTKQMLCVSIIIFLITLFACKTKQRFNANLPKKIVGKDDVPMVLIPAGEFQMGSNNVYHGEIWPVHMVYLDSFYIDKYEVTNAQYRRFVEATGHKEPEGRGFVGMKEVDNFKPWLDERFNGDKQPVVCVSWYDAKAYAHWVGKRLPTEAEWEKAARGGLVGKRYPWGDEYPNGTQCNFADKNEDYPWSDKNVDDGFQYTAPVGSYPPNGYGLYDMAGNVREWCSDWYEKEYLPSSPRRNPTVPSSGEWRVLRDGSWLVFVQEVVNREYGSPTESHNQIGFRCAKDAKQ